MSDSHAGPEEGAAAKPEPQVPDEPSYVADEPPYAAEEPSYDPAAPAPLGVERTPTGNADVDARLARLGDADHLATDGHIEVYEDVHGGLRDALTALDERPGPPVPSGTPATSSSYDNRS
ncbi:hypothetical protein [Streptomyces sp. WAC 01529]|uniref:hypothetical protein n=1 Tax=Streptomyces sp. WAC 01529 TaxID=2203205 RepID=UPI001F0C74F2|nr:hypothetical protein [Streptomyces sp. WAC 01529]